MDALDTPGTLADISRPFTFAVIGDTHYSHPKFYPDLEQSPASRRPLAIEKYIENVDYVLTPMMEALQESSPSFIVLTGDLVEGSRNEGLAREEMKAGLDYFESYGIPVFLARGNHDAVQVFNEVAMPRVAERLGWVPEETYYFWDVAGCRLVFLDTGAWISQGRQSRWLDDLLRRGRELGIDRTFVFGHHPIWPAARAFFTHVDLARELAPTLGRCAADGYFCGHTHNQSILLHRTTDRPVLQLMGAPIGLPEEIPTPLDRVQGSLPGPDQLLAQWPGYLENTAPGWFTVTVGDAAVRADWHHLNRGPETSVVWRQPGDLLRLSRLEHPPDARLITADLSHIRRAFLRFCAWDASGDTKRVLLNGVDVGSLPAGSDFSSRRMELPASAVGTLSMVNRLEVQPVKDEKSTLGNLLMEVVLPGGRVARTRPTGQIQTWSNEWDVWDQPMQKLRPLQPVVEDLSFW